MISTEFGYFPMQICLWIIPRLVIRNVYHQMVIIIMKYGILMMNYISLYKLGTDYWKLDEFEQINFDDEKIRWRFMDDSTFACYDRSIKMIQCHDTYHSSCACQDRSAMTLCLIAGDICR